MFVFVLQKACKNTRFIACLLIFVLQKASSYTVANYIVSKLPFEFLVRIQVEKKKI